ncbi:MAG TPA: hypothetical protein VKT80_15985, partial [Chloroflexota bacterium]|nr:hypothetical protein [Chloroflexota bacterium]
DFRDTAAAVERLAALADELRALVADFQLPGDEFGIGSKRGQATGRTNNGTIRSQQMSNVAFHEN